MHDTELDWQQIKRKIKNHHTAEIELQLQLYYKKSYDKDKWSNRRKKGKILKKGAETIILECQTCKKQ